MLTDAIPSLIAANSELVDLPLGHQPLTPPAVRPATILRWNSSTMMISGTVTTVPAAIVAVYSSTRAGTR